MIVYTAKAPVEISGFQVYADGSGAPAVVRIADFAYAVDFLGGDVRLNCIKSPSAGRRASEVAAKRAEDTYRKFLMENTSPEWREANVRMYEAG